jgi:hypothetical protein
MDHRTEFSEMDLANRNEDLNQRIVGRMIRQRRKYSRDGRITIARVEMESTHGVAGTIYRVCHGFKPCHSPSWCRSVQDGSRRGMAVRIATPLYRAGMIPVADGGAWLLRDARPRSRRRLHLGGFDGGFTI